MGRWQTDWAPSTSTRMPRLWARRQSASTGVTVPSTLEQWETASSPMLSSNIRSAAVRSTCPPLSRGMTRNDHPFLRHICCHGMKLEWCSSRVTATPFPPIRSYTVATRSIPSVAPAVKVTCSGAAPRKAAAVALACS